MPAFQDLAGQKFNYLTTIKRVPNNCSRTIWLCKCDCGNNTEVAANNLKSGQVKSCGCMQHVPLARKYTKNEVGKRFSRLVAVELIRKPRITKGKKNGNSIYFRCMCDCGNETVVWGAHLRAGKIVSCGCYAKEVTTKVNTVHGLSGTKEYIAAKTRKRKERMRRLDSTWTPEMELVIRNVFPACVVCGKTQEDHLAEFGQSLHIDHVYPLSGGNGLEPGNATVLCVNCNSTKQSKNPEDLPSDMREKILQSANEFKRLWNSQ